MRPPALIWDARWYLLKLVNDRIAVVAPHFIYQMVHGLQLSIPHQYGRCAPCD